jgi:hypothetical protein
MELAPILHIAADFIDNRVRVVFLVGARKVIGEPKGQRLLAGSLLLLLRLGDRRDGV